MSFDEQLREAFESLTVRFRDEIERRGRALADELIETARAEHKKVAEEARTAADAIQRELEGARKSADAARADADEARQVADDARANLDKARADMEAVRKQFDAAQKDLETAKAFGANSPAVQHRDDGSGARERLRDAVAAIDRARSLSDVLDALLGGAGSEAPRAAVLLVRDGTLRGWGFSGFSDSLDGSRDRELSLDKSGVIGRALAAQAAASSRDGDAVASAPFDLPDGRERIAIPISVGGDTVALLYADEGANDPSSAAAPGWAAAAEILARHAARALEALTAFKTARALTDGRRPGERSDADEAARHYARLLVSEIKLYHEAEVTAGRRERDLASRLGGEIERARVLYEERVPAEVRLRTDFFQAELVRTLADGDATLLEMNN